MIDTLTYWHTVLHICGKTKLVTHLTAISLETQSMKRNKAYMSLETSWKHLLLEPAGKQAPLGAPSPTVWLTTWFSSQPKCLPHQNNIGKKPRWQKIQHKDSLAFSSVFLKAFQHWMSLKFMWFSIYTSNKLRLFTADGSWKWQLIRNWLSIFSRGFTVKGALKGYSSGKWSVWLISRRVGSLLLILPICSALPSKT